MLTFILITIGVFLTLCYFGTVKRARWAFKATGIFFIIFLALAVILPTNGIRGTKVVAEIPTDDWNVPIEKVYYDAEEDVYFRIESNLWNPLTIHERVPIDYEKASAYMELKQEYEEALAAINLLE